LKELLEVAAESMWSRADRGPGKARAVELARLSRDIADLAHRLDSFADAPELLLSQLAEPKARQFRTLHESPSVLRSVGRLVESCRWVKRKRPRLYRNLSVAAVVSYINMTTNGTACSFTVAAVMNAADIRTPRGGAWTPEGLNQWRYRNRRLLLDAEAHCSRKLAPKTTLQ
jgi:hypothetical protein